MNRAKPPKVILRHCWLLLALLLAGCAAPAGDIRASIAVSEAMGGEDTAGYARVTAPRPFVFPADHGAHPEYQIEWWYYTGNLAAADGRRFGFQFTIFRRALAPAPAERQSAWATRNIYMAHLAVADVQAGRFYAYDRFSRDGAGLAGASGDPFRVFLEDWSVEGSGPEGMTMRILAAEGEVALDLTLDSRKPPALQGEGGLSQKGREAGNASYYYSLTRMEAGGTLTIGGQPLAVSGLAWMDHEWGTSALDAGVIGWDWFSIQLDDGRELMFFRLRRTDGATSPFDSGTLVEADGSTVKLGPDDVSLEATGSWQSPRSGATYPSGWRLALPERGLELTVEPLLDDQELPVTVVYWEGAVRVTGSQAGRPVTGYGYVELTGYAEERQGRF